MSIINELRKELFHGVDVFDSAQKKYIDNGYPHTFILADVIKTVLQSVKPKFWLEVGSMVGGSAIKTAIEIEKLSMPTEIVCIDPFCADVAAWSYETQPPPGWTWQCLQLESGRPTIYERFLANVAQSGQRNRILPIPVTSAVGVGLLRLLFDQKRISTLPEVIYLDSAHGPGETFLEVQTCWNILPIGGALLGDDWDWEAVRTDVSRFAHSIGKAVTLYDNRQWALFKDSDGPSAVPFR